MRHTKVRLLTKLLLTRRANQIVPTMDYLLDRTHRCNSSHPSYQDGYSGGLSPRLVVGQGERELYPPLFQPHEC